MSTTRTSILVMIIMISLAIGATAADTMLEVYADSTLVGEQGFLLRFSGTYEPTVTYFIFEEGGRGRIFAYRLDHTTTWEILPPGLYFSPSLADGVGDAFATIPDGLGRPCTSTLEGFENVMVPAGIYNTVRCVIEPDADPGNFPVSEIRFFTAGVGLVRQFWPWDRSADVLINYTVVGGTGYMPMAVGNWWEYDYDETSAIGDSPAPIHLLYSIVPNPFNPSTEISFELAFATHALLAVYDLGGRLVRILVDGRRDPGRHAVRWDGKDALGRIAPAGVYQCRFSAGEVVQSRRMTLVK